MDSDTCANEQIDPAYGWQVPASGGAATTQWERNRFTPNGRFANRGLPCIHTIAPSIIQSAARNFCKVNFCVSFETGESLVPYSYEDLFVRHIRANGCNFLSRQRAKCF